MKHLLHILIFIFVVLNVQADKCEDWYKNNKCLSGSIRELKKFHKKTCEKINYNEKFCGNVCCIKNAEKKPCKSTNLANKDHYCSKYERKNYPNLNDKQDQCESEFIQLDGKKRIYADEVCSQCGKCQAVQQKKSGYKDYTEAMQYFNENYNQNLDDIVDLKIHQNITESNCIHHEIKHEKVDTRTSLEDAIQTNHEEKNSCEYWNKLNEKCGELKEYYNPQSYYKQCKKVDYTATCCTQYNIESIMKRHSYLIENYQKLPKLRKNVRKNTTETQKSEKMKNKNSMKSDENNDTVTLEEIDFDISDDSKEDDFEKSSKNNILCQKNESKENTVTLKSNKKMEINTNNTFKEKEAKEENDRIQREKKVKDFEENEIQREKEVKKLEETNKIQNIEPPKVAWEWNDPVKVAYVPNKDEENIFKNDTNLWENLCYNLMVLILVFGGLFLLVDYFFKLEIIFNVQKKQKKKKNTTENYTNKKEKNVKQMNNQKKRTISKDNTIVPQKNEQTPKPVVVNEKQASCCFNYNDESSSTEMFLSVLQNILKKGDKVLCKPKRSVNWGSAIVMSTNPLTVCFDIMNSLYAQETNQHPWIIDLKIWEFKFSNDEEKQIHEMKNKLVAERNNYSCTADEEEFSIAPPFSISDKESFCSNYTNDLIYQLPYGFFSSEQIYQHSISHDDNKKEKDNGPIAYARKSGIAEV